MLKKTVGLFILIAVLAVPVVGQTDADKGMNVSAGMFFVTDGDASDVMGNGIGVTLDKKVRSTASMDLHASVGYYKFSGDYLGYDVDASIIPLMVTGIYGKNADKATKTYYGLGVGLTMFDANLEGYDLGNETDFAYQLLGGVEFGKNMFAEAKYLSGGRNGNTGFGVNVGMKF